MLVQNVGWWVPNTIIQEAWCKLLIIIYFFKLQKGLFMKQLAFSKTFYCINLNNFGFTFLIKSSVGTNWIWYCVKSDEQEQANGIHKCDNGWKIV